MATAIQWLDRLTHLRVDAARGNPAPHKLLLLLVLLDLAEANLLPSKTLPLSPDLAFRFFAYFKIVAHRRPQRPDIRLPFYHLHSDGFWSPLDETGQPTTNRRHVHFAQLPEDLVVFLRDPAARSHARRLLSAHYFTPGERLALYAAVGLSVPSDDALENDPNFKAADGREARQVGREVRFRIGVVNAYDYTCALTGYRLTTITGASIVDAAHIHPFSRSANNSIDNSIAPAAGASVAGRNLPPMSCSQHKVDCSQRPSSDRNAYRVMYAGLTGPSHPLSATVPHQGVRDAVRLLPAGV